MTSLNVELHGELIGSLNGEDWRSFDFEVAPAAIVNHGLGSVVLSLSVPLLPKQPPAKADRRRNYFNELLPEGDNLKRLAEKLRVPSFDVLKILTQYGRDVSGAIQIYDPEQAGEPKTPGLIEVTETEVGELLRNTQAEPLANEKRRGRSSLPGVQEKIVLTRHDAQWNRAIDGYPTTHILKPSPKNSTTIYDEEYGQRISRLAGIAPFSVDIQTFDGLDTLVVQRFDRTSEAIPRRIHQEDMNQALGASGNQKYQDQGGKVSLKRIANAISIGPKDSAEKLLRQLTISLAIGNLDMHAKNISILHYEDGSIELTPAYDMVPLVHVADDDVALSVNRKYRFAQISGSDIVAEAESWGVKGADEIIQATLTNVLEIVASEKAHPKAYPQLRADIESFTKQLLAS